MFQRCLMRYVDLYLLTATVLLALKASMALSSDTSDVVVSPPRLKALKLILLDRDGVINEDVGSPGVLRTSQLQLTPNAGHAIGKLKRSLPNASVVMVTNQSCVGKGCITQAQLDKIQDRLQKMLREQNNDAILDKIYECTSTRSQDDPRMKPQPGMIFEAMKDFGISSPAECCWIGDTLTDLQAAAAADIQQRFLVATGYGRGLMEAAYDVQDKPRWISSKDSANLPRLTPSVFPFIYCSNLASAVDYVLMDLSSS